MTNEKKFKFLTHILIYIIFTVLTIRFYNSFINSFNIQVDLSMFIILSAIGMIMAIIVIMSLFLISKAKNMVSVKPFLQLTTYLVLFIVILLWTLIVNLFLSYSYSQFGLSFYNFLIIKLFEAFLGTIFIIFLLKGISIPLERKNKDGIQKSR